ncbi:MAG: PP2C family protein-serine/threonine phosphatase [Leptospiraceae bacterium]|nr:PP2C family protein-serine/threonine phosphatase [Leptospiraceae bacterium]
MKKEIILIISFLSFLVITYLLLDTFYTPYIGLKILLILVLNTLNFVLVFIYLWIDKKYKNHENGKTATQEKSTLRDLTLARNIQESLFPKFAEIPGMEFVVFRKTHTDLGGDFYDFVKLREGNVGIFMTDVAGHGIASAMVASMIKVMVATIPYVNKVNPEQLLDYLDKKMSFDFHSQHATAIYIYINFQTKEIYIANGGHPYIIYQKKGEEFKELESRGSLLGYSICDPVAENFHFTYEPGDRFFIYTDGLVENLTNDGRMLESQGLVSILNEKKSETSLEKLKEHILEEVLLFNENKEFNDDVMFMIVELK